MTVELVPIMDTDVAAVADFLHANLNTRVSSSTWSRVLSVPWKADTPNYGFMLRDGQRVLGVYVALYSERLMAGRVERFCNLASWSVLPEYRFHSIRLLKALLAQESYHFTDLAPNEKVEAVNARLKFRYLDTSVALLPHLPWPTLRGRTKISADADVIASTLAGPDLELYPRSCAGAGRTSPRGNPRQRILLRDVPKTVEEGTPGLCRHPIRQQSQPLPAHRCCAGPLSAGPLRATSHLRRVADRRDPATRFICATSPESAAALA